MTKFVSHTRILASLDNWILDKKSSRKMITKSISTFIFLVLTAIVNGKQPSKIYNGEWAKEGEFPFVVSIFVDNRHFCGGSIITDKHIVTAAHCLAPITQAQFFNMGVRSHTIDSEWGGQIHRVRRMWTHRYYNSSDPASLHDIGLIELEWPVQFDAHQKWIGLQQIPMGGGHSVLSVGWGFTESHPTTTSRKLKKIALTTVDYSVCQNYLSNRLWEGQICTASPRGYGLCHGDSGGPLITREGNLVGLVSWGIPCALGNPDVFTNVPLYYEWITNIITQT